MINNVKMRLFIFIGLLFSFTLEAQEVLFSNYFDIEINASAGAKVIGKVNLKRNKDVETTPIPASYQFYIENSTTDIFEIETEFDNKGHIFGVFKVAAGKNTGSAQSYDVSVVLKDGALIKGTTNVVIKVVEKTLWTQLKDYYTPITISQSRLYGRTKFTDSKLTSYLTELENSNGRFSGFSFYTKHPSTFAKGALEKEWQDVSELIGGLGYAYAKSPISGVSSGNLTHMKRLKRVIYKALLQYMNHVPIYGNDILVGGNPIGTELGDGISKLNDHGYVSHSFLTHQWRLIDALGAPLLHIWPEVLIDIEAEDLEAKEVFNSVMRFHQSVFSEVPSLRIMNDDHGKWKNISNVNYSEGAWADANLGHRMRTLLTMPILWADYNRPITYVPYWYDDYYNNTPLQGKTFAHHWSPNGVLADVKHWCERLSSPTQFFSQAGFHPDGTITHHKGYNASDVAMVAYGFEWLLTNNDAAKYFKNTSYEMDGAGLQFVSDRIDYTYRRMIYKNSLDFLVTGRSFFTDLSHFGSKDIKNAITDVMDGKNTTSVLFNESELLSLKNNLVNGTHAHTGTTAFWNADYLMHRKESGTDHYYFSVKHKSVRTAGAEDFDKIRKSWHAGSGSFLLRVTGDEYSQKVLHNFDWHVIPGVTEGWRTDVMPTGEATASLPGGNIFSGILSDGTYGLSGYVHKPIDMYTSAEALKSYHFIGNYGTAIGSSIKRKSGSSGTEMIVTTIDQSEQLGVITYNINGSSKTVAKGASVNIVTSLTGPTWIHHQNKGYLIFPKPDQNLLIKTGSHINITATDLGISKSINYILALDHGVKPTADQKDGYTYVMVANVTVGEMPNVLAAYHANVKNYSLDGKYHAITDSEEQLDQVVFFQPNRASLANGKWIEVDKPALVMLKELEHNIRLTLVNPLHDLNTAEITVKIPARLVEGTYTYHLPGISPIPGETATVTSNGSSGSTIVISLPSSGDGFLYGFQEQMYAGAPIVLTLEKDATLGVDDEIKIKNGNLRVYPMPIKEGSVVETSDGTLIFKIEIYNTLGQRLGFKTYDGTSFKVKLPLVQSMSSKHQLLIMQVTTSTGLKTVKLL